MTEPVRGLERISALDGRRPSRRSWRPLSVGSSTTTTTTTTSSSSTTTTTNNNDNSSSVLLNVCIDY